MLCCFFDNKLTTTRIPLLRRWLPSLFNTYRDQVCDYLSAIDPINFPRFGQNQIAASDTFVHMCRFEGDRPLVSLKFTCGVGSHQPQTKEHGVAFILLVHNVSPAEHGFTKKPTFQLWLSSYSHKIRAKPPQCQSCHTPSYHSSLLVVPPPWIWIDIPPGGDQLFTMPTALTLEQESGSNTSYTLAGIVYAGMGHFRPVLSTLLEDGGPIDGMVNSRQPPLSPITEDAQLATLGDWTMHILLYRLDLPILLL